MSCTDRCRKNGIRFPTPNLWRKLPYALLLASLLVFGFRPKLLTEKINPDAQKLLFSSYIAAGNVFPPAGRKMKADSIGNRQFCCENK